MSVSIDQNFASRISAKTVVIDLLSSMPAQYPVAVGALVRGGAALGISENSLRVALARLRARALVESDARGLYRLGTTAEPVNHEVRSWRSIKEHVGDWDGSWVAVETSGRPRQNFKTARTCKRALRLQGFETLLPGLRIRPNNLIGGVERVRRRLTALGYAPAPIVFELSGLDQTNDAEARSLWDVAALEEGYARLCEQLLVSGERLPSLPSQQAMSESFRLGGEAVRRIVLDPLLPEAIIDTHARHALFDAMRHYDRLGRDCWKAWAGESVELERSPADVGELATAFSQP
ncbi:MAG: hypothetical protein ABGX04_14015 [Myxococcales bacterium]